MWRRICYPSLAVFSFSMFDLEYPNSSFINNLSLTLHLKMKQDVLMFVLIRQHMLKLSIFNVHTAKYSFLFWLVVMTIENTFCFSKITLHGRDRPRLFVFLTGLVTEKPVIITFPEILFMMKSWRGTLLLFPCQKK